MKRDHIKLRRSHENIILSCDSGQEGEQRQFDIGQADLLCCLKFTSLEMEKATMIFNIILISFLLQVNAKSTGKICSMFLMILQWMCALKRALLSWKWEGFDAGKCLAYCVARNK